MGRQSLEESSNERAAPLSDEEMSWGVYKRILDTRTKGAACIGLLEGWADSRVPRINLTTSPIQPLDKLKL